MGVLKLAFSGAAGSFFFLIGILFEFLSAAFEGIAQAAKAFLCILFGALVIVCALGIINSSVYYIIEEDQRDFFFYALGLFVLGLFIATVYIVLYAIYIVAGGIATVAIFIAQAISKMLRFLAKKCEAIYGFFVRMMLRQLEQEEVYVQ